MMVPDIPRLYTAIAEWAACLVYVLMRKKRFSGVKFWLLAALFLVVFVFMQIGAGMLPLFLWIPGMAVAMLTIYLCIYALGKNTAIEAVFWTARAFVLAEFAASLEWQFNYYLVNTFDVLKNIYVGFAFLAVVYFIVYASIFLLERRYSSSNLHLKISGRDLISVVGIALVVFLISNISFISKNTPLSAQDATEIFYIRTLVDLCGIILFYAQQEQRLWLDAKLELGAMQNILTRQYEQYCLSKDNIELLNRRYHDLKNQIGIIKAEDNPEKRYEYIEEMEKGIKLFDARNQTGNKVLDTILFSKSTVCLENDINFTCVADGTLLQFMDIMDICSIVGNALDNAIESVSQLEQHDKRLIKMAVYAQNNLLMMRFENYIEKKLDFENGLPLSTKQDKDNHGYGIKSIKRAVEQYGGNLKIDTQDNWFSLCLLIPIETKHVTS